MMCNVLSSQQKAQLVFRQTHPSEWFQKTQTGLVLSSVSIKVYSKVMGGSRTGGRGGPSWCTVALNTAVLITGRFGSLKRQLMKKVYAHKTFCFIVVQLREMKTCLSLFTVSSDIG